MGDELSAAYDVLVRASTKVLNAYPAQSAAGRAAPKIYHALGRLKGALDAAGHAEHGDKFSTAVYYGGPARELARMGADPPIAEKVKPRMPTVARAAWVPAVDE